MSLEDSMAALAKSNTELAAAQSALAEAQLAVASKYDEMIAFVAANNGGESKPGAAAKAEDKPKGRGRPKKEPEPEPEADDGLGGEEEEEESASRTSDEVKALLKKLKDAGGVPRDIMSKFGAKAFPELKDSDFDACYAATEKALAKL